MPEDPRTLAALAQIDAVLQVLRTKRFRFTTEAHLQAALATALDGARIEAHREHELGPGNRVDFWLPPAVALEVKIAGSAEAVQRQLERYAAHPSVAALILVTSRWQGSRQPDLVGGKPLRVHVIARAFA